MQFLILKFIFCTLMTYPLSSSANIVSRIRGSAFVLDNSIERKLLLNDIVKAGQKVRTEKSSFVQIKNDDGLISIGPNSVVEIKSLKKGTPSAVSLIKGQIRATLSKEKSEKYKLKITTNSVSLGVRGTDFHIIHNDINNISTAISYEGNVELSSINAKNNCRKDDIIIQQGEFSGVYTKNGYVNAPAKFSKKQFDALLKNTELKSTTKKAKKKSYKIKSNINQSVPPESMDKSDINNNIAADLLGREHRDIEEKKVKLFKPKQGGFIDLKTAMYITPPPNSKYDPKTDMYIPPDDYGEIDEITGEYIPPYGLILLPLKGFVYASSKVQKGVKFATDNVGKAGKFVWEGVKSSGEILAQKTKKVGKSIKETIGAPAEFVEKGVSKIADVAMKTNDKIIDTTGKTLSFIADQMNTYLNDGFLDQIRKIKSKIPLVSSMQIDVVNNFSYASKQTFYDYNHISQIVDVPSFANNLFLKTGYKKFISKDLFIRPTIEFESKDYTRDKLSEIKALKNKKITYGLDIGLLSNVDDYIFQTYFFVYKFKQNRFSTIEQKYKNYITDHSFGFSKAILKNSIFASRFDYTYSKLKKGFLGQGSRHNLKLSEIIKLKDRNFLDLGFLYSRLNKDQNNDKDSRFGISANYYHNMAFHDMRFNTWTHYLVQKNGFEREIRGTEKNIEAGAKLNKKFKQNFQSSFQYTYNKNKSQNSEFNQSIHQFMINLEVSL